MTTFSLTDGADDFPPNGVDLSGNDSILGLGGADSLLGGLGNDTIYGGDGNDTISGIWLDNVDTGADVFDGGNGNDVFLALPNADGIANDTLFGGAGADEFHGGRRILGGGGDDSVTAGSVAYVDGGAGNDTVYISQQADAFAGVTLAGGEGTDRLTFIDMGNGVPGTPDWFDLQPDGKGGFVITKAGMQVTVSGFEILEIRTDADSALLVGGAEQDHFIISGTAVDAFAGAGQDRVTVDYSQPYGGGSYEMDGGEDVDVLQVLGSQQNGPAIRLNLQAGTAKFGTEGASSFAGFEMLDLLGTSGADSVTGGTGADTINGDVGADILKGGQGDDVLTGGFGADQLTGAGGRDQFVYRSENDGTGAEADVIFGFAVKTSGTGYIDRINLSGLDAVHSTAADEAFVFIGQAEFSAAGQVRIEADGVNTRVLISTDGDSAAEVTILLDHVAVAALGAEDFIL